MDTEMDNSLLGVFRGFIPTSMVDWDGKIVSTLYLPYCNMRCPFCHNKDLVLSPHNLPPVPWEEITGYLKEHLDFIDGVCITGGEPTLHHPHLVPRLRELKKIGLGIKLDTNGTNPDTLKEWAEEKLIDYVAMDVKAPLDDRYYRACGKEINLEAIKKSIRFLLTGVVGYEFRTTVVPGLHTEKDIVEIAEAIKGAERYVLQQFVPKNSMDPAFEKKEPYPPERLMQMADIIERKGLVSRVKIRGLKTA